MHKEIGPSLGNFSSSMDSVPVWERLEDSRFFDVKRLEALAPHIHDPATSTTLPPELARYSGPLHCSFCPKSRMHEDQLDLHFRQRCVWIALLVSCVLFTERGSIVMQISSTPTSQKATSTGLYDILCLAS